MKNVFEVADGAVILLIWLALVGLFGCGADEKPSPIHNPELMEYVKQFQYDARKRSCALDDIDLRRVRRVPEDFEDYGVSIVWPSIGFCIEQRESDEIPGIGLEVNLRGWHEVWIRDFVKDEKQLRGLMYHELGHCYLSLDHVNKENHLMHETVLYTETDWDDQVDELFEGCRKRK